MIRVIAAMLVLVGFAACGTRDPNACCVRASNVARGVVYSGEMPSPDGGAPTRVTITVQNDAGTIVTFTNSGVQIAQEFSAR